MTPLELFFRKVQWKLAIPWRRRAVERMLAWDVKVLGYEMARQMALKLGSAETGQPPAPVGLTSKGCVQADIESPWFAYWAHRLKATPIYHRKLWEFCFILQALWEAGALVPGAQGLGFGCGEEPLPSLFAQMGVAALATDAPSDGAGGVAWNASGQYAGSVEALHQRDICAREAFDRLVRHRPVDMRQIPPDLAGAFDFTWSACAFEHLGTIAAGLDFVERSIDCLKPGGVAVHTTEWNYGSDGATMDHWSTVLFQRRHFEALRDRLLAKGCEVAPFDYDIGEGVLDRFIDVPPYRDRMASPLDRLSGASEAHLRVAVEGFASTSFGIIARAPR